MRTAAEEGVKDWFRFFDLAPSDTLAAGALSGTPTAAGSFSFPVELRDYDRLSTPVTKAFQLVAS